MWRRGFWLICIMLSFRTYADSFVRFEEQGKVGLKDGTGRVLIPPTFEALGWSDGNFSVIGQVTGYKLRGKWGIINLQKQFLTAADFESLVCPGGDRVIASKNLNAFTVKYGCLDLAGKVVVPFNYDGIKISGLRAIVFNKNGIRFEHGVIDLNDRSVIPMKWHQITPLGTLRYNVENNERKSALFSEDGKQLTPFAIDSISSFHHGYAIVYQDFACGVIDREGEIKVPATYQAISIDDEGSIKGKDFDDWGIVDAKNQTLYHTAAESLIKSGDFFQIIRQGKYGLVNYKLESVVAPVYDFLGPCEQGHWVAASDGKYGVIRKDKSFALPLKFDSAILDKMFVRVSENIGGKNRWSVYDTFGIQKTRSYYDEILPYNGKFFPAKKGAYWGAVNRYGDEFIHCVFDSLLGWRDGLLAARFRGQFGIITEDESWVVSPQDDTVTVANADHYFEQHEGITFLKDLTHQTIYFTNNHLVVEGDHLKETAANGRETRVSFQGVSVDANPHAIAVGDVIFFEESEGMRRIKKDGKFGFVDTRGRLRIANRYDDAGNFHEELAPVKLIGKWGFVDLNDRIAINPNYDKVGEFTLGLAIVLRQQKEGLIDKNGKTILPIRYDRIIRNPAQTYLLEMSGVKNLFGLADQMGSVLIEPRFEFLNNLGNGFVMAGRDGKFGLLTREGMSAIPMVYDGISAGATSDNFLLVKRGSWKDLHL
jgi:hypothetical protein